MFQNLLANAPLCHLSELSHISTPKEILRKRNEITLHKLVKQVAMRLDGEFPGRKTIGLWQKEERSDGIGTVILSAT